MCVCVCACACACACVCVCLCVGCGRCVQVFAASHRPSLTPNAPAAADPTAMHTVKVGDNNAFAIASADRARGALARAAAQHRPKPPSSGGPRRPGSRPGSRPSQVPALDMGKLQRSGTAQSNDGRAGKAAANGGKASQAAVEPYREFVEEVMNKFLRLIAKYTRDDAGSGDEDGGDDGGDTGGAGGTEEGGDSDDAATHAATADGEGDHGDASGGGGGTEPSPEVQHLYKCYGIMMGACLPVCMHATMRWCGTLTRHCSA